MDSTILSGVDYPRYSVSIILPVLSAITIVLDIPPLVWHAYQRNLATTSLCIWVAILNVLSLVNPIIWPRDNMTEWWDGHVLCDIETRIIVGSWVALPGGLACILRKLAKVLDTKNIVVAPSRSHRIRELVFDLLWCWIFPVVSMVMYYFVQTVRYFIYGISGCGPAFHTSWATVVFVWMWGPLLDFFAAYYAVVLLVRLYRYRSQFSRLINAQNTTRSRFLRLFFLAFILIVGTLPLNLYILYDNTRALHGEPYDWNRVHEHTGDMILSVPSNGHVRYEAWVRIAAGFLIFFHLGTGTDAGGIYRGWMEKLGLGKVLQAWGASTASVKTSWFSLSSKTKSAFKSKGSQTTSSTATVTSDPHRSTVSNTSTTASMLKQPALPARPTFKKPSFFSRLFQYAAPRPNILPVSVLDTADSSNIYFVKSAKAERAASANQWTKAEQAALYSRPRLDTAHVSGSTATAWSTERSPSTAEGMKDDVVVVRHEVVVENEKKEDKIHVEKQDLYGRLVSK